MISEGRRQLKCSRVHRSFTVSAAALMLSACGGQNTDSQVESPGRSASAETQALEAGAKLLQDNTPVRTLNET